jgi:hypothetical protein
MRPDLERPFVDWLAWLLNASPQLRPASVAQALDVLMRSMQSGFVYQVQEAPQMQPGAATGVLIAGPSSGSMPRPVAPPRSTALRTPSAPLSKPIQSTNKKPRPAPAPTKKRITQKGMIGVLLNVLTLTCVLWIFRPYPNNAGWNKWWSASGAAAETAPAAAATPTVKSP